MSVINLLKRLHITLLAYWVKFFRTRAIVRTFQQAHQLELKQTPVNLWPVTMARQAAEIAGIRAGKLDAAIVDRKSWQWPFMPSAVQRLSTPLLKACYSADTEVLTRRGWVAWPDVVDGEEFLARDPKTGTISYEEAQRIIRIPHTGPMVHFDSSYVDILVTPEHRMFGRYRGERMDDVLTKQAGHFKFSTKRFVPAKRVVSRVLDDPTGRRFCIPTSGKWAGKMPEAYCKATDTFLLEYPCALRKFGWRVSPVAVDFKSWLAFLGIFVAEGSVRGSLKGMDLAPDSKVPHFKQAAKIIQSETAEHSQRHQYEVRISQVVGSEDYVAIEDLLSALPFDFGSDEKGFGVHSKLLHGVLWEMGNTYNKGIPDWVKQLPPKYLEIFFEWACRGDGHHYESGTRGYWTVSKRLADDMNEILVKMGKDAQLYQKRQRGSKKWGLKASRQAPIYLVREHGFYLPHSLEPYKALMHSEQVDYEGYVYCCTVPSGVVMVRRNGKIAWCGQSPYNIRRMSRTPVPRRAMNLIKGALISQNWEVRAKDGVEPLRGDTEEQKERIKIATRLFSHPNNEDSFQTYLEQGLEDFLVYGAFVAEMQLTPDPERPLKMWTVNVESIRLIPTWRESTPDQPRYAQMTGLKGERGAILFYDDELIYIKDNPSTDNPFGLGKMEVAFASVNDFLGIQGMSGRAGTDQVHKCFPEWTEVLTRRGWIPWRETTKDDEFATRSLKGRFQWQRALGFVKEWHDGDLLQFHNRNLNITVTPNHRMYGNCVYKDWKQSGRRMVEPLGFVEANTLFAAVTDRPGKGWQARKQQGLSLGSKHGLALADFRVPMVSVWDGGDLPSSEFRIGSRKFKWEDWAAFLGIWIAEGSCLHYGQEKPREYRIQIAQSKKSNRAKYARIESLLKRMRIRYYAKSDRILFSDREIWAYLGPLGGSHTKYVPQWIKNAPASIIRVFVEWAMMGDGSVGPRGKRIYLTVSKRLADDMQELFQKIGSSATVHLSTNNKSKKSGLVKGSCGYIYAVEEMLKQEISIVPDVGRGKQRVPERIMYSGYVYCAMVPNGTLYCRENGYPFWSGNTMLWWESPQSEAHVQIIRRYIQNELEGQAKLSLIAGMKKPEVVEVTPVRVEDLLLPWQELLIRMMANAFDMSAMALGVEHDINRAVGEVLDDKDFRSAVVPVAKRIQESNTRKVLHGSLGWTDLEFWFLNLDDPDLETRIDMFQKMYGMNAVTSNDVCRGLNRKILDSPLGNLTQFECMLLNIEAMAMSGDWSQRQTLQRQLDVQKQQKEGQGPEPPAGPGGMPGMPPGGGPPGAGLEKLTPSSMSKGGQPPSPKPLSLPKFPMQGSAYTAKQIAFMPVNQVTDVFKASGMRASQFLTAMNSQEPGILQDLTDEVKQFFKSQLDEEEKNRPKRVNKKQVEEWRKQLAGRIRERKKRITDMAKYIQEKGTGTSSGIPGAGKPGDLNPNKKG